MKKMNRKGFTLIELLAVIVVLAIILVITVPMILNTLGSTREDAFEASATSIADYYRNQLSLESLGKAESNIVTTYADFDGDGKLCESGKKVADGATTCSGTATTYPISDDDTLLGITAEDYNLTSSTVKWDATGKVTVNLVGAANGEFEGMTKEVSK